MRRSVYSFISVDRYVSGRVHRWKRFVEKKEVHSRTRDANFLTSQATDIRRWRRIFRGSFRSGRGEPRRDCGRANNNKHRASAHVTASRDYCNFAIFQQDKGLLISQRERQALPFGTLRGWINAALTSRLRDYPNYSSAWDLMQVRTSSLSVSPQFILSSSETSSRESNSPNFG